VTDDPIDHRDPSHDWRTCDDPWAGCQTKQRQLAALKAAVTKLLWKAPEGSKNDCGPES